MIPLGQKQTDNIIRMITINKWTVKKVICEKSIMEKYDHTCLATLLNITIIIIILIAIIM